jgi:ankyrin repeat protein
MYLQWMIHGPKFSEVATATIKLLTQYGLNIQSQDIYGDTALSIAVKDRAVDIHATKTILKQNDRSCIQIDQSLNFLAIEASSFNNDCSKISELLVYGFEGARQNSDGSTLLHHCVIRGATAALRLLVTYPDIDIEIRNREGLTPLQLASKIGSIGCLNILCGAGASVNSQVDGSNDVPLSLALAGGSIEAFYGVRLPSIYQAAAYQREYISYFNTTQTCGWEIMHLAVLPSCTKYVRGIFFLKHNQ